MLRTGLFIQVLGFQACKKENRQVFQDKRVPCKNEPFPAPHPMDRELGFEPSEIEVQIFCGVQEKLPLDKHLQRWYNVDEVKNDMPV